MVKKELCFVTATPEEIALLVKHGDSEALKVLWEQSLPTVDRIAGHFHRRYPWIDQEDISQAIAMAFPKIIRRFDASKATSGVNRYLYFAFYRTGQDFLRYQDPLGIRIPGKKPYPSFSHFTPRQRERATRGGGEEEINESLRNMDRGYLPNIDWLKR